VAQHYPRPPLMTIHDAATVYFHVPEFSLRKLLTEVGEPVPVAGRDEWQNDLYRTEDIKEALHQDQQEALASIQRRWDSRA
jgi:hypothetical protein